MTALLGVTVVFASFGMLSLAGALLLAPWVGRMAHSHVWRPATRARLLLGAQAGPALLALSVALGVILPAFLRFEPSDAKESPGWLLLLAASVGAVLLVAGVTNVGRAIVETRRLRRAWLSGAQRLEPAHDTPAFCVDTAFPIVAVVGVVRPLLFVARSVVEACPARELEAIVAHEAAHLSSRDNLKRIVMRGASTVWSFVPGGHELVRAWTRAVEEAADERATAGCPERRLELASALARVARLATCPAPPAGLAASALFTGPVETRIRRLLAAAPAAAPRVGASGAMRVLAVLGTALAASGVVVALPTVHAGIEVLVRTLP